MMELTHIMAVFDVKLIDYDTDFALMECVQTENKNNDLIKLFDKIFPNRFSIVRGGSVAIEAISLSEQ